MILLSLMLLLGLTAFVFWISAAIAMFRMLRNRNPGSSLFEIGATGVLNENNFNDKGKRYRQNCFRSIKRFFYAIGAITLVVLIGISTQ